jgi:hypothetical protein
MHTRLRGGPHLLQMPPDVSVLRQDVRSNTPMGMRDVADADLAEWMRTFRVLGARRSGGTPEQREGHGRTDEDGS